MSTNKKTFTAAELVPGQIYQVINPLADYDRNIHPVGERWRFVKKSFLPYEDGLTLWVETDERMLSFRLQWRAETQAQIIEHFSDYVIEIG
jgi:hypothetical protein